LPQEENGAEVHPHAIADFTGKAQPVPLDFTLLQPGFLLSPFIAGSESQAQHITAHAHLRNSELALSLEGACHPRHYQFLDLYHSLLYQDKVGAGRWYVSADRQRSQVISQEAYQQLVAETVQYIRQSGVRKVVTSRVVDYALPAAFDPVVLFERLCQRYAHAFVSLVAIPGIGTWIGASPETLVRIDDRGVRSMALAGTQAKPASLPLEQVRWGAKETEEQAVVSKDIRDFFQRAKVMQVEEQGPHTVAAGNVVHLQTTFRVNLPAVERLELANRILTVLHPTSAVCGMPKERALSFIQAHEGHDRSYYSGFLGPVQIAQHSDLFVNLRCMQLSANKAHLYVGGGITSESDPAAEWRETELKAHTLLDVLR
jgi:isochorismate synthase